MKPLPSSGIKLAITLVSPSSEDADVIRKTLAHVYPGVTVEATADVKMVAAARPTFLIVEAEALARSVLSEFENYVKLNKKISPEVVSAVTQIDEPSKLADTIGSHLLVKISEFYDQQVSATVESLTSLIEPLMIGVMGVMVGSIVLSVFLPILKIQQLVSH